LQFVHDFGQLFHESWSEQGRKNTAEGPREVHTMRELEAAIVVFASDAALHDQGCPGQIPLFVVSDPVAPVFI
jgi:hypothetical protein